jgi:hypothetical protein
LQRFAKGETGSGMGRAISMMAAGLGNKDYADTLMEMEGGLFSGEGGDKGGLERSNRLMEAFKKYTDPNAKQSDDNAASHNQRLTLAQELGISQKVSGQLLGSYEQNGGFKDDADLKKWKDQVDQDKKGPMEKAADSIEKSFSGIDPVLNSIHAQLEHLGTHLLTPINKSLKVIADALGGLNLVIDYVKKAGMTGTGMQVNSLMMNPLMLLQLLAASLSANTPNGQPRPPATR